MIEKKIKELCSIYYNKMEFITTKIYAHSFDIHNQKDFFYKGNPQTDFFNEVHDFMKKSGVPYEFKLIDYLLEEDIASISTTYVLTWYDGVTHIIYEKFITSNIGSESEGIFDSFDELFKRHVIKSSS